MEVPVHGLYCRPPTHHVLMLVKTLITFAVSPTDGCRWRCYRSCFPILHPPSSFLSCSSPTAPTPVYDVPGPYGPPVPGPAPLLQPEGVVPQEPPGQLPMHIGQTSTTAVTGGGVQVIVEAFTRTNDGLPECQ